MNPLFYISNTHGSIKYGLNEDLDLDFDLRQAIHSVQFADVVNIEGYRRQFSSISKDFLNSKQQNFDPEIGCFRQGLSMSLLSMEKRWWSLFRKYWLVKNERND